MKNTVRGFLIEEEGWRNKAYPDPLTKAEPWTIGVGHTGPEVRPDSIWSNEKISATLSVDIHEAREAAQAFFGEHFAKLNDVRQAVVISMIFQMGLAGFRRFRKAIAAIYRDDWEEAAKEMLDSLWAKQTPRRAFRTAEMMRTGEWQPWDPREKQA